MLQMKRISSICTCLVSIIAITSCTNTRYATSRLTLDRSIEEVKLDLAQKGYALTGSGSDTKNNMYVEGTSYSQYTGYGTKMANDIVTTDTYRFTNDDGSTMNFTLSYKVQQNAELIYVTDVIVAGCETSVATEYEKLCGQYSSVKKLEKLPQDTTFKVTDVVGTTLLATVLGTAAAVVLTLILLL